MSFCFNQIKVFIKFVWSEIYYFETINKINAKYGFYCQGFIAQMQLVYLLILCSIVRGFHKATDMESCEIKIDLFQN